MGLAEDILAAKTAIVPGAAPAPIVPAEVAPAIVPGAAPAPIPLMPVEPIIPGVAIPGPLIPGAAPAIVPGLGGGSRLNNVVMDALTTATIGNRRNKLPLGTGIFLLKSGKFIIPESQKHKISTFSFLCLAGVVDSNGINPDTQGYSGPVKGETYDVSIFLDFDPKYAKMTFSKVLSALAACLGWSDKIVKQHQSTPEGVAKLTDLLKGLLCFNIDTLAPTGDSCMFSNQVVVQLSAKISISDVKDANGQPTYNAQQEKITKTYTNEYWDKKLPLADVATLLGTEEAITKAFDSLDAFTAAYKLEQSMATL